jgi:hypothetical protein
MGGEDDDEPGREGSSGQGRSKAGPTAQRAVRLEGRSSCNLRTKPQSGKSIFELF